jgi:predicted aspartyl protease
MINTRFSHPTSSLVVVFLALSTSFGLTGMAADLAKELPFKLLRGTHVLVKGSVGDERNVNMLIDTGAATTTVDERLVKRLGLETKTLQATGLIGGAQSAGETELPNLSFGLVQVAAWNSLVLDLSQVKLGERLDIIIGLDILQQLPGLTIDYERQVLSFTSQEPFETTVQLDRGLPLLRVRIESEGVPLVLMLDSGADGIMLFDERVRAKLPDLVMNGTVSIHHVGGTNYGRRVELVDVALGDRTWDRLSATLLGTPAPAGLEIDGLLSLIPLEPLRVCFDFENNLLSWE